MNAITPVAQPIQEESFGAGGSGVLMYFGLRRWPLH